jgi:hypothetical protein
MVSLSQLQILGVDGKPVLYGALQDGELRLEFEYYGHSSWEADLEIIYAIGQDEFALIKSKFGCAKDMEILDALATISMAGHGVELRDDVRNGLIKSERFSWISTAPNALDRPSDSAFLTSVKIIEKE